MGLSASESSRGAVAVAVAAMLWGTWKLWLVGPGLDSGAQGGLVLTTAGVLASGLAIWQRGGLPRVSRRAWLFLAGYGVAEAINCGLYFLALTSGDTATAAVTHYLAPVLIAVASPLLREPLGRRALPAAIVSFAATLALVGFGATSSGTRLAALAGAGSAVFYAACVFLAKRVSGVFRPWELVGFHDLIAGPLIALTARTSLRSASSHELGLALVGAVVGGTIATGLYLYGLSRVPAARAGILAYLEPVSASLVGATLLHETITSGQLVAMCVILLAGAAVALETVPNEREPRQADGPPRLVEPGDR
jgi:drug/metabolite transporter (DMT)-like permease